MEKSVNLIFTDSPAEALARLVAAMEGVHGIFLLADSNTAPLIAEPLIRRVDALADARLIEVPAGDSNKNLTSLTEIWQSLTEGGATRRSLLICVGGGMITDIGGFAASTFKRGIRFINMPTTLLAAVDASIGGKTGINFHGLKNEIGLFNHADAVVVSASHFATLPYCELTSGYAELLKHALIDSPEATRRALAFDLSNPDWVLLHSLLRESIAVKERIVAEDPHEQGLRKALNLGHTMAHAFESLAIAKGFSLAHGHAVAWGLIADMVLSNMILGFDSQWLSQVAAFVREYYPRPFIECADYDALLDFMRHDKKNITSGQINFTLLQSPGHVVLDCTATPDQITAALDIMRDLL